MSPSELTHVFLDGEVLEQRDEAVLFEALASDEELRLELRDLLAIRAAVQSDTDAFGPPAETTRRLFAGLGISGAESSAASVGGGMGAWLRRLWIPLLAAVAASIVTGLVLSRWNAPVTTTVVSVEHTAPAVQPSAGAATTAPSRPAVADPRSTATVASTARPARAAEPRVHTLRSPSTRVAIASNHTPSVAAITGRASRPPFDEDGATLESRLRTHARAADRTEASSPDAAVASPSADKNARTSLPVAASPTINERGSTESFVRERPPVAPSSGQNAVRGTAPVNAAPSAAIAGDTSARSNDTRATASTPANAAPQTTANVPRTAQDSNAAAVGRTPGSTGIIRSAELHGPASDALPKNYAGLIRGLALSSSPSPGVAAASSGLPTNVVAGLFRMFDEHNYVGIEIGQEVFGQEFDGRSGDSAVHYQQNPVLMWGAAAYRAVTSPLSFLGGIAPFAQADMGATRVGPLARVLAGLSYSIGDRIDLMLGAEGAFLWYQYQTTWFRTTKVGVTYGVSLRF